MDISQFKKKFIDEAETLLTKLNNVIIELEKDMKNTGLIDEAFRIMHTLKGASGMFGYEKIVETTHEMESIFDLARNNQLNISQPVIDVAFAVADHIKALLTDEFCESLENKQNDTQVRNNIENIKNNTSSLVEKKIEPKPQLMESTKISTWNILFYPSDELIKRAVNLTYTFQDLFALGEYQIYSRPIDSEQGQFWSIFLATEKSYDDIEEALMFIMDNCRISKIADYNIFNTKEFDNRVAYVEQLAEPEILDEIPTDHKDNEEKEIEKSIIEVKKETFVQQPEVKKELELPVKNEKPREITGTIFKSTMNRINVDASKLDALMYLVSELVTTKSELMLSLRKNQHLKALDAAEKIEKLSKQFSENALSIRLVSLQELLNRFKRLVRDLSKQLGKEIEFITECGDTELDKNIIDTIGEPIMHLIRNCIDHGIETPEKRLERKKPVTGIIRFEAYKSGNFVFLSISDDGNGIDTDYIYKKAVDKGFITDGTPLNENEIYNLIFLPGFSTAQSLSNISGRGVGMDIVLKKIQEIRGEISISSEKGVGTTFHIKLQQTISIIETLLVSAGNITYAIPIENVESCGLEARENLVDRQSNLIEYNKELIPFMNMRDKYSTISCDFMHENEKLVIIKKQERRYALVVDNIIGEYQAVIKPLGKEFSGTHFISGASLLGDGSIAILLNTDKLWFELSNKN